MVFFTQRMRSTRRISFIDRILSKGGLNEKNHSADARGISWMAEILAPTSPAALSYIAGSFVD